MRVPESRDCVLVIQGGGVYALSLLGQARAVLDAGYRPRGFAGTSAGAIVAALLWANVSQRDIERELLQAASAGPDGLASLLGTVELGENADPVGFEALSRLASAGTGLLGALRTPGHILFRAGRAFASVIRLWCPVSGVIGRRGLYHGRPLTDLLDRLLRLGPLPDEIRHKNGLLTFGDFHAAAKSDSQFFRPPLFITATNLSSRRLELITSMDRAYDDVPVASAVRASASVPGVFRPVDLPMCGPGGTFVDGGVITNFPAWVFSRGFRERLNHSEDCFEIAGLPWIRVGLRVGSAERDMRDVRIPESFWGSLFRMLTGDARNQLDSLLARDSSRSITIRQPEPACDGPAHWLDFPALGPDLVKGMVRAGYSFAKRWLDLAGRPSIMSKASEAEIRGVLDDLVTLCAAALGVPRDSVRASLHLVDDDTLVSACEANFRPTDTDRGLDMGDLVTGLTGQVFSSRLPHVCNLEAVAEHRRSHPAADGSEDEPLFGMPEDMQAKVADQPDPPTWLAATPVRDPTELRGASPDESRFLYEYPTVHSAPLPGHVDGPLFGVLGVHCRAPYGAGPGRLGLPAKAEEQARDVRVKLVLGAMNDASALVAILLSRHFPADEVKLT